MLLHLGDKWALREVITSNLNARVILTSKVIFLGKENMRAKLELLSQRVWFKRLDDFSSKVIWRKSKTGIL